MAYPVRVAVMAACTAASLRLVADGGTVTTRLAGVALTSLSMGVGEGSFLALSAKYTDGDTVALSAGFSFAGVATAPLYAALTRGYGYSPRAVFSAAAVGPGVVVLGVYAVLSLCCRRRGDSGAAPQRQPSVTRAGSAAAAPPPPGRSALAIDEKWDALLSTAPLVASLASCYAVHYTTKAALFVHLAPAAGAGGLYATAPKHGFYVHYTSAERIASFSGRLLARRLPAVTAGCFVALQLLSLAALFLCVLSQGALRDHLPFALDAPLWALVAAAAWVGALNGVAYVSILLMVRRAAGPRAAEFVLGVASGADDLGIMLASAWSVPLSH
eukprot:TRINITY_DN29108_c0_g1_i2.p1 TRINITY_DN29108_c0_g1~~TRINITY_DN29108_c0_g1_i2.p1  ORF type:complete len:329 (+),score=69.84 TRINITY_DN29108_c0_g1_i2:337-1323(+)